MDTIKYLPIGSNIGNKHEVMDVLGEDEFEILYLVRDTYRKGSFFVLKELFLETFSSRTGEIVRTTEEAIGVFNKRKIQIVQEINTQKRNIQKNEIKIYGYQEANETIYTIMEFSNNADLEKYLQFTPKDGKQLPSLSELIKKENRGTGISFFIKIFLLIIVLLSMAFYAYQFFKEKRIEKDIFKTEELKTKHHPILKDRRQIMDTEVNQDNIQPKKEMQPIEVDQNISIVNEVLTESIEKIKLASTPFIEIPIIEEEEENISIESLILSEVKIEENLTEVDNTISIGTSIKNFLDAYIKASSHSATTDVLKYYDKGIRRYFRFRNPTPKTIRESQERYNNKWVNRSFKIIDFEIVKSYKKDNLKYFDLQTTTVWDVSNEKGEKSSGQSRGFMILKEVENSFKINSIYTLN